MTSNNLIKKATKDGWISLDYLKEQTRKRKITFWLPQIEEKPCKLSVACTSRQPLKKMKQSSLKQYIPNLSSNVLSKSNSDVSELQKQNIKPNKKCLNSFKKSQHLTNTSISNYFKTSSSVNEVCKNESDSSIKTEKHNFYHDKIKEIQPDCDSTTDYDSDETFIGSQDSLKTNNCSEELPYSMKEKIKDIADSSKIDDTLNNNSTYLVNESNRKHYNDNKLSFSKREEILFSESLVKNCDTYQCDSVKSKISSSHFENKNNSFIEESTGCLSYKHKCSNKVDKESHCSQNILQPNNVKCDNSYLQETLDIDKFIPESLQSVEFSLQTNKKQLHEVIKQPINYNLDDDYTIKWVEDSEGQLIYDHMTQRKVPDKFPRNLGKSEGFLEFEQGIISREPDQSTQNKIN